jgi:hypothetical protein
LLALGIIGATLLSCDPSGATTKPNVVAQFLGHADRQYESEEQRIEIMRALGDMLSKPAEALRAQRYEDYQGAQEAWPLTTLLKRYFVPTEPIPEWDDDAFYRDVSKWEARQAIRRQLSKLKNEGAAQ